MNAPRDDRWILRSRALLDESAARLPPARARALAEARERALAQLAPEPRLGWRRGFLAGPALALPALVLALGLGVLLLARQGSLPDAASDLAPAAVVEDSPTTRLLSLPEGELELLATGEAQDLVEDYEFYVWLGNDATR